MRYFDYEKAAREAGISPQQVEELGRMIRQEFPKDEMMYELHLLRVCMAIQQRLITIKDALKLSSTSGTP